MGNKGSIPRDNKIVVVGTGYGGSKLGFDLLKEKANFLVIDTRDCMHQNMAAVRAVAIPGFVNKTFLPYKPAFKDYFKKGKVVDVLPNQKVVKLQSGEEIKYDTLVLATGTTGPFPTKIKDESTETAKNMYDDIANKVKAGNTIAVVGGGAAGVELASEIATEYPDKTVTLVHSREQLMQYPKLTDAFQQELLTILKRNKVNLVLNERVTNLDQIPYEGGSGTITTNKGTNIHADVVLRATGLHVNSDAYSSSSLKSQMEKNGALKVNQYLEVEGHKDIYAIGDCNNTPENKLAFAAEAQASFVLENIRKKANNKELVPYKPGSLPIACMLALGRESGIGQFAGGRILSEFFAKRMKAADVFVASYWKKFGQKPPE